MQRNHVWAQVRVQQALVLGAILAILSVSAVFAADGNNGTVKVHAGATDNERIINEESHVCTFHLHFFFADVGQQGSWQVDEASPTGSATSVFSAPMTPPRAPNIRPSNTACILATTTSSGRAATTRTSRARRSG